MGLKAAVQALKKAEELKAKVSQHSDLLNNSEAWSDQQQLQTIYHQVLVLDLEYALDKKVEQELWTLVFKNHIAALQHLSRDKKNPRRSECQALLSWCLEAASGFYLTLLQELCSTFELELPFRRRGAVYGQTRQPSSDQLIQPQKTSCLYICQYCLVHLGDIARYRGQRKQAESFYRHAILLSPSSGQPYNQLALLEASRGDRLATVFHYVRSISVKYPFPAAATNLANTFSALIDSNETIRNSHSKLSQNEFILIFLRVHSFLHTITDLDQAETYIKTLNATFTALVATQMFSATKLIQITAINMYAFTRVNDSISANQLTNDEVKVKNLVLELLAGALNAFLLPIYTINESSLVLDYFALPAIKLTLDWIKTDPSVLNDTVFTKRLQFWPSFCKLLNNLQEKLNDFDSTKYIKTPLPEDRDLQCFLPLVKAFKELDFNTDNLQQDTSIFNSLRITRLVELGTWLCSQQVNNNIFMTYMKTPNTNIISFEPKNKQLDPTTELLEELKFFNIKDTTPAVPPKESTQNLQNYKSLLKEKRSGILKPQGSLEKSREEREAALLVSSSSENDNSSCNTSISNSSLNSVRSENSNNKISNKRIRQNVAMQAIAKKVEENNKQVTFQTEPIVKTIEKDIKQKNNSEIGFKQVPINNNQAIVPHSQQMAGGPHQYPLNYNGQNQNLNRISNINVGNIPFSAVPFPNNPSGMFQNNLQFSKPPPNVISNQMKPNPNLTYDANLLKQNPNNLNFNTTNPNFDPNMLKNNPNLMYESQMKQANPNLTYDSQMKQPNLAFNNQNLPLPPKDPFTPWHLEEKPPLPPNSWWSNQKMPLQNYPPPQEVFNKPSFTPYNQNIPQNMLGNFVSQDLQSGQNQNFDFNPQMQYNHVGVGASSNFGNWNTSGPLQNNMHQFMNQGPGVMQQNNPSSQNAGKDIKRSGQMSANAGINVNVQPQRETTDSQTNQMPGYSLFNSNWAPAVGQSSVGPNSPTDISMMRHQSLFSGPGPSPLERLLQQQRQMRGGPKDHT